MNEILGKENIWKLILKFSIPAIVGQLVFALYNIVDRMFIGQKLGTLAISSVSVTLPLFTIIIAFGMLVGVGAASRISIALGEKNLLKAEKILGNSLFLFVLLSFSIMIIGISEMDKILYCVGATDSMIDMASSYMYIIFGSIFFNFMAFGINGIIIAEGTPRKAMYIMLFGAVVNIFLDYIFVILLDYGVKGAASATAIANMLSASITIHHFIFSKHRKINLKISNIYPNMNIVKNILSIGSSSFILQIGVSLAAIIANTALLKYGGDAAVGAMGVINSVYLFVAMVNFGIVQGVQPLLGYNYGAKLYKRVRLILKQSILLASVFSFVSFIPILFIPEKLVSLFSDGDIKFIELTVKGMFLFLLGLPIVGYNTVCSGYFQAIGKAKKASFLFFTKQIFIYSGCLVILPHFYKLDGVFLSGSVSEFILFCILIVFVYKEMNQLKNKTSLE